MQENTSADDAAAGVEARAAAVRALAAVVVEVFGKVSNSRICQNHCLASFAGASAVVLAAVQITRGMQHHIWTMLFVLGLQRGASGRHPAHMSVSTGAADCSSIAQLLGDVVCGALLTAMEDYTTDNR
jgi:ABC-type Fe3+-siderophore transport system permease subunit